MARNRRHEEISAHEVARILGVSRQRVHQLAVAGRLPFTKTIFGRVYRRDQIERFHQERKKLNGV